LNQNRCEEMNYELRQKHRASAAHSRSHIRPTFARKKKLTMQFHYKPPFVVFSMWHYVTLLFSVFFVVVIFCCFCFLFFYRCCCVSGCWCVLRCVSDGVFCPRGLINFSFRFKKDVTVRTFRRRQHHDFWLYPPRPADPLGRELCFAVPVRAFSRALSK